MSELTELGTRDLTTFDRQARDLIDEMQAHGWRGRMSRKTHALMYSPDGTMTASVSRDSSKKRTGLNARRPFNQWLQMQHADEAQPRGESFGTGLQFEDPSEVPPWESLAHLPTKVRAEMKRRLIGWWQARDSLPTGTRVLMVTCDPRPDEWAFWHWVPGLSPLLIAHGPVQTRDPAEVLYEIEPSLRPQGRGADTQETSVTTLIFEHPEQNHAPSPDPLVCPECGKGPFVHGGALALHRQSHLNLRLPCPEPGCPKVYQSQGNLAAHINRVHSPRGEAVLAAKAAEAAEAATKAATANARMCPVCKVVLSPQGMPSHLSWHLRQGDVSDGQVLESIPVPAPTDTKVVTTAKVVVDRPAKAAPAPKKKQEEASAPWSEPDPSLEAGAQVEAIRALVSAPLVAENARLRKELDESSEVLAEVIRERDDYKARLDIINDAMKM